MPLNFSAAHSSRISKKRANKTPLLKRSSSSSLNSLSPRKSGQRARPKQAKLDDDEDFFEDHLDDRGLVASLATDLSLQDVPQYMRYIRSHMFDPMPEKGGMNSTRIAEVLNFRKSLPPTITLAHVHALTKSPTSTEREIAELAKAGILKKTIIPGRGIGASSVGDGLILSQDLEVLLKEANDLDQHITGMLKPNLEICCRLSAMQLGRFWQYLVDNPTTLKIPQNLFTSAERTALMRAGFLTSTSISLNTANVFIRPNVAASGTMTSLINISRAVSGSVAAVGGDGAIHGAGNTGKDGVILRNNFQAEFDPEPLFANNGQEFHLALPNTGLYLKLLTTARGHIMSLLLKTKYRELPVHLLRERWDGGIAGDDPAAKAKKSRGEFTGVLPGRTRKWKQFYGLAFDWVLAECLGAGLVEVFDTGSVGRAVRAI